MSIEDAPTQGYAMENNYTWITTDGRRIIIRDDVTICVSTIENKIMHRVAVEHLDKYYDMCLRHCPDGSRIPGKSLVTNFLKNLTNKMYPSSRRYNIFGLDLETTIMFERRRQGYQKPRINQQYKLHVPYFVIESVKCLELFGLEEDDIFQKCGDPFRLFELMSHLSTGRGLKFNINSDVNEVATLLKFYFQKMPEGLFTESLEYVFTNTTEYGIEKRIRMLSYLIKVLPRANRETLFLLLSLLHRISLARSNNMSSRKLNNIFSSVLFRYKRIVNENSMGVLQTLIDYFPLIFTLKAKLLNHIYKKMLIQYPDKLDEYLRRRINQCHCDPSDIPPSLRILTKQRRSFDPSNLNHHGLLNDQGRVEDETPEHHNHKPRTVQSPNYISMMKRSSGVDQSEVDVIYENVGQDIEMTEAAVSQYVDSANEGDRGHIPFTMTELRRQ